MALENRQHYIEHEYAQPLPQQPQAPQPQKQPKKEKTPLITMQEKVIYMIFLGIVAAFAISILHKQADLQKMTIEVENLHYEAQEIAKQNVDLKIEVSELSKYERIWEKAQALGLTLNEKNVKVVPGE